MTEGQSDSSMADINHLSELLAIRRLPVSLNQVLKFIGYITQLKDNILLAQPANFSPIKNRPVLPPTIQTFIANACYLPVELVNQLWVVVASTAWHTDIRFSPTQSPSFMSAYATFGHQVGLSMFCLHIKICAFKTARTIPAFQTIYPMTHHCINSGCARSQRLMLKKSQSRQVVLFTLSRGAVPAWATHLYCERELFLYFMIDQDKKYLLCYKSAR